MDAFIARTRTIMRQPDFAGLLASTVALGMAFSFVMPLLSIWGLDEIKMKPLVFGVYMMVTSGSAIVISTVLARWSDTHVPRKVMLLLGGAGGTLGYLGYAFAHDPRILICIGCTGIALASVCFSQLFAHVREASSALGVGADELNFRMSIVRVGFSLAWTMGPPIGELMMARFHFRGVFLGASALYALFFIGVLCFVPYQRRSREVKRAVRQPVWRVLTRADIGACFTAFLLFFSAHTINMMNLPLRVTKDLGGTPLDMGMIFTVGPIVEIPLMLWFGHLAGRGHQLKLIRFGAVTTVLYFLALTQASAPWHVYVIQILSGIVFAIMSNVAIVFFQDLVPGEPGLATTIFGNASNLGSLAGYFCFGTLVTVAGHRGVFGVCAALTTLTLIILVCYRPRAVATNLPIKV
jgi:SET family sugar efflux transporter-like MFS transporter